MKHNLKTRPKPNWYLAHKSTPEKFFFLCASSNREVCYTVADGWTYADALSFHAYLMGWEPCHEWIHTLCSPGTFPPAVSKI
jgi:hypothetical protein